MPEDRIALDHVVVVLLVGDGDLLGGDGALARVYGIAVRKQIAVVLALVAGVVVVVVVAVVAVGGVGVVVVAVDPTRSEQRWKGL